LMIHIHISRPGAGPSVCVTRAIDPSIAWRHR
jgi:hypothetical protein